MFVFINWYVYVLIKINILLWDDILNFYIYLLRLIYKNNTNQLNYIFSKNDILGNLTKNIMTFHHPNIDSGFNYNIITK